jgi:protein phosphatase
MVRAENQDAVGKFPPGNLDVNTTKGQLFIIADGMGGHAGGREASRLAVETVQQTYALSRSPNVTDALAEAFRAANRAIYDFSLHNPMFHGMGTTCIALVMKGNAAYVAHIGDSRLYRITPTGIKQLTEDHSKVAELVRRGVLTAAEAESHPERSMLYRAMGVHSSIEFDLMNNIEVGQTETFLMCTDGLSNLVDDNEMSEIVLSHAPQGACDKLVDLANRRGGYDNITVQIVQSKAGESFLKRMLR